MPNISFGTKRFESFWNILYSGDCTAVHIPSCVINKENEPARKQYLSHLLLFKWTGTQTPPIWLPYITVWFILHKLDVTHPTVWTKTWGTWRSILMVTHPLYIHPYIYIWMDIKENVIHQTWTPCPFTLWSCFWCSHGHCSHFQPTRGPTVLLNCSDPIIQESFHIILASW